MPSKFSQRVAAGHVAGLSLYRLIHRTALAPVAGETLLTGTSQLVATDVANGILSADRRAFTE